MNDTSMVPPNNPIYTSASLRRLWTLQYVLTDDSALEQLAVQEVVRFLCTVHSMRPLHRRLSRTIDKPAFKLLKHAMLRYTGIKYRELCEQVVLVSDANVKKYVEEQ